MDKKDLYAFTLLVEKEYQMGGLGAEQEGSCLYADFAVDVALKALEALTKENNVSKKQQR